MVCPSFAWGAPFATGAAKCTRFKDSKEKKKAFLAKWIQGWKFCCQTVVRLAAFQHFCRSIFINKSHIDVVSKTDLRVTSPSNIIVFGSDTEHLLLYIRKIRNKREPDEKPKEWRYMRLLVVRALSRSFPGDEKWISPGVTSKIKGFLCGELS